MLKKNPPTATKSTPLIITEKHIFIYFPGRGFVVEKTFIHHRLGLKLSTLERSFVANWQSDFRGR